MKFPAFLQSLLPGLQKDQILEDLRLTKSELANATLPGYKTSESVFKSWTYKAEEIQNQVASFKHIVPNSGNNIVMEIYDGLKIIDDNIDVVKTLIEKTFDQEVAAAGMTYTKANLIQYVELLSFVVRYARKYLVYVYVLESSQYENNGLNLADSLKPVDLKYINENFVNFCTAFKAVTLPRTKTEKAFEDIPDIVVSADNEEALIRSHGTKIDPLSTRFIASWLNPIYHIRMAVVEWQHSRYKAAQEELKVLQLRKLHLERLKAGKPDANLEKEIMEYESRIQALEYKISSYEAS